MSSRLARKVPMDSGTSTRPDTMTDAPNPKPDDGGIWMNSTTIGTTRYMDTHMRNPETSAISTERLARWWRLTSGWGDRSSCGTQTTSTSALTTMIPRVTG